MFIKDKTLMLSWKNEQYYISYILKSNDSEILKCYRSQIFDPFDIFDILDVHLNYNNQFTLTQKQVYWYFGT